jgi:hypothetical protein
MVRVKSIRSRQPNAVLPNLKRDIEQYVHVVSNADLLRFEVHGYRAERSR